VNSAYAEQVLADNPASYWRLGEAGGTSMADVTGANPGTYTGGVTLGQPGALVGDSDPAV
jgi:signal peptidase